MKGPQRQFSGVDAFPMANGVSCMDAALHYAERFPITLCIKKAPKTLRDGRIDGREWESFTWEPDQIVRAFELNSNLTVGGVLGPCSGHIDFDADEPEAERDFARLFEGCELDVAPTYQSKRGKHRIFRWSERLRAILAMPGFQGRDGCAKVMFGKLEIRIGADRGAHSLLPPSTTDGFQRRWCEGLVLYDDVDPPDLPELVITRIIEAAASKYKGRKKKAAGDNNGERPGDDFNLRGDWSEILTPHGWTLAGSQGGCDLWRRPGKSDGQSATTGFCSTEHSGDLLYVFTSTKCDGQPFDHEHAYSKFAAFTLLNHGGDFKEAAKALAAAGYGKQLPTIKITSDLKRLAGDSWKVIQESNDPPVLFRHGGLPARIEHDDQGAPIIREVRVDELRHRAIEIANWTRTKKLGDNEFDYKTDPPDKLLKDILATPDMPLPRLHRIVRAPVFAADGTISTAPGYHAASRTYFDAQDGCDIPPVADAPSDDELQRAVTLIRNDLLIDFPFTSDAERAHAIAFLLLPFARELIGGATPLHLFEKPSPGTGASLLVDVLAFPALGAPCPVMTEGNDEDGWRKRITATLMGGPTHVLIDNLRRRLDSAALSAAITAPVWVDRILGKSKNAHIPVRCVWAATGNNPAVSSEISRRCVRIRLDAKQDRPWLREEFKHADLRGWCRANRGRLIWACLTMIQAWLAAGRPKGECRLGNFEDWSETMGGILAHAGIDGFLSNANEFYEQSDTEGAAWRAFLAAWQEKHGDAPQTTRELYAVACDADLPLGDKGEHSARIVLGKMIGRNRDNVFAIGSDDDPQEVRICSAGTLRRAVCWKLETVNV